MTAQKLARPETEITSQAIYELTVVNGDVVDKNGRIFSPEMYSRFKYGDGQAVRLYASMLSDHLTATSGEDITSGYVASSAYKHVPTAAHSITQALLGELVISGNAPAGIFRIDRDTVHSDDYSSLCETDRLARAEVNGLRVADFTVAQLEGKSAYVIDDIKITGTHERSLHQVLGTIGLKRLVFGYIATVDPEITDTYPEIEYEINHAYVGSLSDLVPIASSRDFILNARTCKFILTASEADICGFVNNVHPNILSSILASMVADGYHNMPQFKPNFSLFAQAVSLAGNSLAKRGQNGHVDFAPYPLATVS